MDVLLSVEPSYYSEKKMKYIIGQEIHRCDKKYEGGDEGLRFRKLSIHAYDR